jgi:hypothetical protein
MYQVIVFNAPFSNISATLRRPVLMVEEAGVPGENHRPWQATSKLYHLWLRVECTLFVRKPKIQKVKEKKKKKIKVENIGPNKIVVCTEMMMYYT